MPAYSKEKFESDTGQEVIVYWKSTKHHHDASFLSDVCSRLGTRYGGTWQVRANSFQSHLSSPPVGGVR